MLGTLILALFVSVAASGIAWLLLKARQKLINRTNETIIDWKWERAKAAEKKRLEREATGRIPAAIQEAEAPGGNAWGAPSGGTKSVTRDRHIVLAGQIRQDIIVHNDMIRRWYAQPRISGKAFKWLKQEAAALTWALEEHLRIASLLDSGNVEAANYAMDRIEENRRKSHRTLTDICGE